MSGGSYSSSDAPAMHGEFMGFAGDEASVEMLRGWALRQGFPGPSVQHGGPDMFAQMLESAAPPKMVAIDIDNQADPVAVTQRLVSVCGADCKIIVLGTPNDIGLYRRIIAAGAVDYLVKPLAAEMLNQAMAAALKGNENKNIAREAKIVVVIGARGGAGASTVALNTAWILSHQMKKHVALLDMDLQFGTSSLALDLEPGRGLRDILSSPHRVDALMIASSMAQESEHFAVLAAEEAVDEFVAIDGAAIAALLKDMRGNFDIILVDLPRHLFATQKRLLASANQIVLVTELSLAGVRDTLRIKNALKALETGAAVSVVTARAGQIDAAAFEKGAQCKIDFSIPEDTKTIAEAANTGKPIAAVAKQSPSARALHHLASKIGGGATAKEESGLAKLVTAAKARLAARKPPKGGAA